MNSQSLTGYLHPGYAKSLEEFGSPTELPRSGGWFLKRKIPGWKAFDGMGCYPFLTCLDWAALAADLEAQKDIVSFAAVPDPFGAYRVEDLQRSFPGKIIDFKEHYLADLSQPTGKIVCSHHRKEANKALRKVEVEFHSEPVGLLDDWLRLFQFSVQRFKINGVRAYSRNSFALQLALPGVFMSIARCQGEAVGAHIWFVHGETAYAHLAAASPSARQLSADYALYHEDIRFFSGKVHWLDWGGEAGTVSGSGYELVTFKKGWSTHSRPVYFCGRILNYEMYHGIASATGHVLSNYFPAYRDGEFR